MQAKRASRGTERKSPLLPYILNFRVISDAKPCVNLISLEIFTTLSASRSLRPQFLALDLALLHVRFICLARKFKSETTEICNLILFKVFVLFSKKFQERTNVVSIFTNDLLAPKVSLID